MTTATTRRVAGFAWLTTMLVPGVALAATGHHVEGFHNGMPFAYEKGLLDNIGFDRSVLRDKGVDLHLSSLSTYQSIVDGGIDESDQYSHSYDLQTYFNSDRLGWWKGGNALIRAEGKTDDSGVNFETGAIIPVNFDPMVPEPKGKTFELTEWWYSQSFADGKVETLVGMYDIARFFDLVPSSGPYHYRFMNAHMFFNSTLLQFAPYNLLGGVVTVKPTEWLTITTGIADPNSSAVDVDWYEEGDFNILHEWRFMAKPFGKPGLYAIGYAYKDADLHAIDGSTVDDDSAFWANFDQKVYMDQDNPGRSISVFGRFGNTDGEVNPIENHYSLGVSFDGMLGSRHKDRFGVVGWYNEFSSDFASNLDDSSSGFEAYYTFKVTPWLELSPDIQYLIDPGLEAGFDDTTVLGARALILF